jgi:hypothetical protein
MGWFSRRKQQDVIEDAEVASQMRKLPDAFISGAAADGWHFSWTVLRYPGWMSIAIYSAAIILHPKYSIAWSWLGGPFSAN